MDHNDIEAARPVLAALDAYYRVADVAKEAWGRYRNSYAGADYEAFQVIEADVTARITDLDAAWSTYKERIGA